MRTTRSAKPALAYAETSNSESASDSYSSDEYRPEQSPRRSVLAAPALTQALPQRRRLDTPSEPSGRRQRRRIGDGPPEQAPPTSGTVSGAAEDAQAANILMAFRTKSRPSDDSLSDGDSDAQEKSVSGPREKERQDFISDLEKSFKSNSGITDKHQVYRYRKLAGMLFDKSLDLSDFLEMSPVEQLYFISSNCEHRSSREKIIQMAKMVHDLDFSQVTWLALDLEVPEHRQKMCDLTGPEFDSKPLKKDYARFLHHLESMGLTEQQFIALTPPQQTEVIHAGEDLDDSCRYAVHSVLGIRTTDPSGIRPRILVGDLEHSQLVEELRGRKEEIIATHHINQKQFIIDVSTFRKVTNYLLGAGTTMKDFVAGDGLEDQQRRNDLITQGVNAGSLPTATRAALWRTHGLKLTAPPKKNWITVGDEPSNIESIRHLRESPPPSMDTKKDPTAHRQLLRYMAKFNPPLYWKDFAGMTPAERDVLITQAPRGEIDTGIRKVLTRAWGYHFEGFTGVGGPKSKAIDDKCDRADLDYLDTHLPAEASRNDLTLYRGWVRFLNAESPSLNYTQFSRLAEDEQKKLIAQGKKSRSHRVGTGVVSALKRLRNFEFGKPCTPLLSEPAARPVPRHTEEEMTALRKRSERFLAFPFRPFAMQGSKIRLLRKPALYEPLLAAINTTGYRRFVEPFAGTGIVSLYLAAMSELPAESILNEFDFYRYNDINQTIHHADEVIAALEKHGRRFREICYQTLVGGPLGDAVPDAKLLEWEASSAPFTKELRKECSEEVLNYLLRELGQEWPANKAQPNGTAGEAALHKLLQYNMRQSAPATLDRHVQTSSRPSRHAVSTDSNLYLVNRGDFYLQTLGDEESLAAGRGGNWNPQMLEKLKNAVPKVAEQLKQIRVTNGDGFRCGEDASPGDVWFVDPPYLQQNESLGNIGSRYRAEKLPEYTTDGWVERSAQLEEGWRKGVLIVMTNRFDQSLRDLWVGRGWSVSESINTGSKMTEMVATNFDHEDGVATIRAFPAGNN